MRGLQFFGQPQHLLVRATDHSVTAHLAAVGGGEAHGDRIGMHIQADAQAGTKVAEDGSALHHGAGGAAHSLRSGLRLDSFGVTE